jgi:hypothetical protein
VWVVKLGDFVPDSERWLNEPSARADLEEAIGWAEKHAPRAIDLKKLSRRLGK